MGGCNGFEVAVVADVFGLREVNPNPGDVLDVFRVHSATAEMECPLAVGVSTQQFALASWFTGTVQLIDRATCETVKTTHGLKAPFDALPMGDGSVL